MTDLVVITDTHHLRIEPETAGVRLVVMSHDAPGAETMPFMNAAVARAHCARMFDVDERVWQEVTLKPFDIVVVADSDPEADLRGRRGHVVSLVDPMQAGVMVYGLDCVWCIHPDHLIPTGEVLPESERPDRRRTIRVNSNGDIV